MRRHSPITVTIETPVVTTGARPAVVVFVDVGGFEGEVGGGFAAEIGYVFF